MQFPLSGCCIKGTIRRGLPAPAAVVIEGWGLKREKGVERGVRSWEEVGL